MRTLAAFLFVLSIATIHAQTPDFTQFTYKQIDSTFKAHLEGDDATVLLPFAQAAAAKAKKDLKIPDSTAARIQYYLGYAYDYGEGDYPTSAIYYQKAIDIFKKVAPHSVAYADALYALADIYNFSFGKYTVAEKFYIQAKEVYSKNKGVSDYVFANCLNSFAVLYWYMGSYEKSEPLYWQAKDIYVKIKGAESSDVAEMFNNLAMLYQDMSNYEKAERFFLDAKEIRLKLVGEKSRTYAGSLNNLALLYFTMGNYEKAEPLFLETMNIFKTDPKEDDADLSITMNNLAMLYNHTGLYEKAEDLYKQTIIIDEKVHGVQHPTFAISLNNLALLYQEMGEVKKAEEMFSQIIDIQRKTIGEEHIDFALSINNLAMIYKNGKQYEKAEPLFLKANRIWVKNLGTEHPSLAESLNNLAELYKDIGKLDTAFRYIQQSFAANSAEIEDDFQAFETLDQFKYYSIEKINDAVETILAILNAQYKKTGDKNRLKQEYQVIQAAMRLNERIRNEFSEEGGKLRSLAMNSDYVLRGIKTSIELAHKGYEQEAFGFAESNKGVLVMDAAKTAHAYKFGDLPDSLVRKEQALQKTHDELKAKLLEKRGQTEKDSLLNLLNKTNLEIENFTKSLQRQYPQYAALKYQNKTAQATEIQALLDEKTALLEYVIGDSVIYIFYVDKHQVVLKEKQISSTILANKIRDLHSSLSNYKLLSEDKTKAYHQYTGNAHWFYENLIAPVLSNAKNITDGSLRVQKLIIVSDGELGHLPFEAFLVEPAPQKETDYHQLHYLINDYSISYNYSATLFKANKNPIKSNSSAKKTGQIFALAANYEMPMENATAQWRLPTHQRLRSMLTPLKEAQKEVQTLAESFDGFFAFDKNASEKVFKEKAGDYSIIHLAMHGLLDNKNPILSSLAFTEDGDSVENNFLQAYEISKMKLNADLVVLSACETGYGKFDKGNGIASLAQAFAYAGAPAMIVSLWQVSDYATSVIMKNLYQNLADGMEKDEALQQAKMEYMKSEKGVMAHPAFWSPFVLMGNTDGIVVEKKRSFSALWAIGIGLAMIGGVAFAARRRKK